MIKLMAGTTLLDRTFRVSLIIKGLDGVLELIGGVLLLLVSPGQIGDIARFVTQHELAEDPRDFIGNYVLHLTDNLSMSASLFGAAYLLLHALVKILTQEPLVRIRFSGHAHRIAKSGLSLIAKGP